MGTKKSIVVAFQEDVRALGGFSIVTNCIPASIFDQSIQLFNDSTLDAGDIRGSASKDDARHADLAYVDWKSKKSVVY